MILNWVLFLDDERHPNNVLMEKAIARHHSDGQIILWAKDIQQAKWYVENYGLPDMMYLDHDLGRSVIREQGITIADYSTTMDFLRWLEREEYIISNEPPYWSIHSQNPAGVQNIEAFMNSWYKLYHHNESEG